MTTINDILTLVAAQKAADAARRTNFDDLMDRLRGGDRIMAEDQGVVHDITQFVSDLFAANQGWQDSTEERASLFLVTPHREAAVKVGEDVNRLLGFAGMQAVFRFVTQCLPRHAGSELESAWHGIGRWRR